MAKGKKIMALVMSTLLLCTSGALQVSAEENDFSCSAWISNGVTYSCKTPICHDGSNLTNIRKVSYTKYCQYVDTGETFQLTDTDETNEGCCR
ncbi:MAG: hypothetical protein IJ282_02565 [Lachnospiraceae bacterium]|nr:hypothetical protein [Lachnospiraceae bacterium]